MSVKHNDNNRQDLDTYDSVLGAILAGRQATTVTTTDLDPDLVQLHKDLKAVDTSQPGWLGSFLRG